MMELTAFQRQVAASAGEIALRFNEPMARHTSFRIGGNAEVMAFPTDACQMAKLLNVANTLQVCPRILGAGTNVLAPDEGLPGLTICLKDCFDGMERLDDNRIRVAAGVTMSRAAVFAANLGLSGLEFAHGIPGSVGGGVYMNAGAYGGELCQVVESVQIMDFHGTIRQVSGEDMGFSYRHSMLEDSGELVLCVDFRLTAAPVEQIKAKMKELIGKRSASQPLDLPSAGSAFKRPAQGYAAALIDQAGLKGYRVGGAGISAKHAGFAVNLGGATAADVRTLLEQVSEKVYVVSGIRLEPEIRIW